MITQKIKFTADVEVLDHNNVVSFSAKAGEVKELPAASCARWIRRNKAILIDNNNVTVVIDGAISESSIENIVTTELSKAVNETIVDKRKTGKKAEPKEKPGDDAKD